MLHTDPIPSKYKYSGKHRTQKVPIQIRNTIATDFTLNVADIDRLFFETKMPLENVRKLWVMAFTQDWDNEHAITELYNWLKEKPQTLHIEHLELQQFAKEKYETYAAAYTSVEFCTVPTRQQTERLRKAKYALNAALKQLKAYNSKEQRIKRLQKLFDNLVKKYDMALFLNNYTPLCEEDENVSKRTNKSINR